MTNLLKETVITLKDCTKKPEDVRSVTCGVFACTWEQFTEVAAKIEYDPGYGLQEISPHLMVVGDDWWLERAEYDGSEWWEFKCHPGSVERIVTDNPDHLRRLITNTFYSDH